MGTLSCLAFNGDNLSQYAMAEGLAEALMMYTKPFNGSSTTEDYYDGEKHCILVAAGNPVPLKMLVTVPRVLDGKLVLGRLQQNIEADFLEVTQLFTQGNNITEMAYAALCNYKVDQFSVMLSRNFKEAREAIHEKRVEDSSQIRNLQSMRTSDINHTEIFNTDFQVNVYEDIMAEMDAVHDNVLPSEKSDTSLEFVENPLSNLFDVPAQPTFDDVQYSLGQDQTNSTIKMVSMEALKTVETELGKTLEGSSSSQAASGNENYLIDLTNDDDEEVEVPREALPEVSSAAITTTTTTTITSGIRSPNGLLVDEPRGNNPWALDFSLVNNSSSSAFLTHQNSSTLWSTTQPSWYRGLQYGNVIPPIRSGNYGQTESENQAENGFGNYLLQHSTQNSVINEFQPFTSATLNNNVYNDVSSTQVGGISMVPFSSQYPLHDVQQGIGTNTTTWVPTMSGIPQLTQWEPLLPPPPSVMDFSDYVQAWEAYTMVG
ncbi:hypothetical protein TanjilG_16169 [Lupinus angustifolius]|uniref:Mediator of RNA polymerase II transcription subunit 25 n=1 Tax=Lupinus angustifolius TaxID=3871 RepID=A0A1J7H4Y9_LUPAN|nr:hypothetical protein TanjilG_16169 [Lupinus angustifolius]